MLSSIASILIVATFLTMNQNNTRLTLKEYGLFLTELLAIVVTNLTVRLYYRPKVKFTGDLTKLRRGALIVSNHQSKSDPFLLISCLPLRVALKILPARFPTAHDIYTSWRFNPPFFPVLKFLGCFSIGDTTVRRTKSVFHIRQLLKTGRTVVLFPEGKINREINVSDLSKGVDFFVDSTHSVLFVRMKGLNEPQPADCSVTYSEVFDPPPHFSTTDIREQLEKLNTR